jgi:hypothetical protein
MLQMLVNEKMVMVMELVEVDVMVALVTMDVM